MKDLMEALFEEQPALSGVHLVFAVTLTKITLNKPCLLFRKMISSEKHG